MHAEAIEGHANFGRNELGVANPLGHLVLPRLIHLGAEVLAGIFFIVGQTVALVDFVTWLRCGAGDAAGDKAESEGQCSVQFLWRVFAERLAALARSPAPARGHGRL